MVLNMSIPIKMNDNYSISKDSILTKYSNIDDYFKNCINALCGEKNTGIKINYFLPCNIILNGGSNNLSALDALKDKAGVYIFLDSDKIPVYIGKGGTSNELTGKDLKFRVGQELGKGNPHNTISNNIIDIESKLQNKKITSRVSIDKFIKNFSILTITVCDRVINNNEIDKVNILNTEALEIVLIALFHPKYNK